MRLDNHPDKLRNLNSEDKSLLFEWRNDSETILASISKRPVTASEHEIWFYELLNSEKNRGFIGIDNSESPLCFIVFRQGALDSFEISINVNPNSRGQGIATFFLPLAISEFRLNNKSALIARVLDENTRSKMLFERLGFRSQPVIKEEIKIYRLD
jgi:RimJ/RimL family protein N-acetyltransferase